MIRTYIIAALAVATALMGFGAFYQHNRYVSLSEKYEAIVEANKALAEDSERQSEVVVVKDTFSKDAVQQTIKTQKEIQQQIEALSLAVQKGSNDDKGLMYSDIPADVAGVLDSAYQGGD